MGEEAVNDSTFLPQRRIHVVEKGCGLADTPASLLPRATLPSLGWVESGRALRRSIAVKCMSGSAIILARSPRPRDPSHPEIAQTLRDDRVHHTMPSVCPEVSSLLPTRVAGSDDQRCSTSARESCKPT